MTTGAAWVLAGALWAGCLAQGPWWLAPAGLVLLAGAVAACRRPAGAAARDPGAESPRSALALAVAAIAVVALGAGLAGGRAALRDTGALAGLAAAGGSAELLATAVTEPRASAEGTWFVVRVTMLDGSPVRERALVRLDGDGAADAPLLGARLGLRATARPLGTDGFEGYVRRLHAGVALDLQRLRPAGPPGRLLAATNRVRDRARAAFDRHLGSEHAALLAGLTVGDTRGRSAARADQFAAASLTHLVVVSGRHVALMLAGVLGVAGLAGAGVHARRVLGLGALVWFTLLVRWQPSVLRAAVMAALVLGAGLLGRGRDTRHTLAMAVVLLLLADPFLAGQLGFVLSVGATAGVLVAAPWLAERLPGPRSLRLALGVTLGAQAGAAPALLLWLDGVPLAGVPANLVAVPAAAVAQVAGMLSALVAQVSLGAGGALALLGAPALSVVLWAAEAFSAGPVVRPGHLLSPVAAAAGCALLARRRPPVAAAACALAVALAAWPALRPAPQVEALTLVAFDVGQGDALLVEVPGEPPARLLFDGGPDAAMAVGHLRDRGVRRLDAVVLSHPHHDHAGGLAAVLAHLDVGVFVVGPRPVERDGVASSVRSAHAAAGAGDVPVVQVRAGDRFALGSATVDVLGPPAGPAPGPNNASVVLRVTHPTGRILLTGDIEAEAQRQLLREPERLRADVLQVPHHGGDTNAPGFLAAVGAGASVISVGEGNDHGHPHPAVLAELATAGVTVTRTDRDGTVTLVPPRTGRWTSERVSRTVTASRTRPRPAGRSGPRRESPCNEVNHPRRAGAGPPRGRARPRHRRTARVRPRPVRRGSDADHGSPGGRPGTAGLLVPGDG